MNATIKCYQCNADIFLNGEYYNLQWDGMEWENESEWQEWADESLTPIANADNYDDIIEILHIYTQHAIKC